MQFTLLITGATRQPHSQLAASQSALVGDQHIVIAITMLLSTADVSCHHPTLYYAFAEVTAYAVIF